MTKELEQECQKYKKVLLEIAVSRPNRGWWAIEPARQALGLPTTELHLKGTKERFLELINNMNLGKYTLVGVGAFEHVIKVEDG